MNERTIEITHQGNEEFSIVFKTDGHLSPELETSLESFLLKWGLTRTTAGMNEDMYRILNFRRFVTKGT